MAYERKRDALDPCPVELVLEMIGGKWKARVIYLLLARECSFAQLRRALPGITQQVLSAQLSAMVDHGIVSRRQIVHGAATRSIYSLSELGTSLVPVLQRMSAWGEQRLAEQGFHWLSETPP
jgi:DNA-binding HxlR family transcriptional regulator